VKDPAAHQASFDVTSPSAVDEIWVNSRYSYFLRRIKKVLAASGEGILASLRHHIRSGLNWAEAMESVEKPASS
jgi:hypothetical protein